MQVSLVMFKVDGSRWDFAVSKPRIVIGRTSHCDLRIPLSSVSRQHCEVRIEDNHVKLRDLGSSNGTHHNHIRVQEATLKPGDEIDVGPVVFTVVIDGDPALIEPRRTMIGTPPPQKSPPAAATKQQPQPLEVNSAEDEFPTMIEAETRTPTVNLDDEEDDALASLQALAAASESDDSGELPILIDDEDDELPPAKQKP